MHRVPRVPATVVAFDGLIACTASARALAVSDAVTVEYSTCTSEEALRYLPGLSLDEAVEAALRDRWTDPGLPLDATVRDLTVLRARRGYSAMVAQGLSLRDGVIGWTTAYASLHGRLILRAESARRDVERILAFSGLDDVVSFVRCADDLPRVPGAGTLASSWRAIETRLGAQGVKLSTCTALECNALCADTARPVVAQVRLTTVLS